MLLFVSSILLPETCNASGVTACTSVADKADIPLKIINAAMHKTAGFARFLKFRACSMFSKFRFFNFSLFLNIEILLLAKSV